MPDPTKFWTLSAVRKGSQNRLSLRPPRATPEFEEILAPRGTDGHSRCAIHSHDRVGSRHWRRELPPPPADIVEEIRSAATVPTRQPSDAASRSVAPPPRQRPGHDGSRYRAN